MGNCYLQMHCGPNILWQMSITNWMISPPWHGTRLERAASSKAQSFWASLNLMNTAL